MPGNDRVRYCPECKLNVYNFSALSAREIDRLVLKHEGRLCGRYFQRADGTMLAQNCPVAVRAMLRWTSHAAAAVMAALVSVSPAFAKPFPQQANSSLTQIHPAKKSLSMVFVDPSGAGVGHTKVTLRQLSTENKFTAETNDAGEVFFSDLPKGIYELTAICPGFRPFHLAEVKAPYGPRMQFLLDVRGLVGVVVEVREPDYQPDKPLSRSHCEGKALRAFPIDSLSY
ncbi:MAG: carboxypeptidase-like regulatory domain-containing protein [Candidatus Acidiferrum sp.]